MPGVQAEGHSEGKGGGVSRDANPPLLPVPKVRLGLGGFISRPMQKISSELDPVHWMHSPQPNQG